MIKTRTIALYLGIIVAGPIVTVALHALGADFRLDHAEFLRVVAITLLCTVIALLTSTIVHLRVPPFRKAQRLSVIIEMALWLPAIGWYYFRMSHHDPEIMMFFPVGVLLTGVWTFPTAWLVSHGVGKIVGEIK